MAKGRKLKKMKYFQHKLSLSLMILDSLTKIGVESLVKGMSQFVTKAFDVTEDHNKMRDFLLQIESVIISLAHFTNEATKTGVLNPEFHQSYNELLQYERHFVQALTKGKLTKETNEYMVALDMECGHIASAVSEITNENDHKEVLESRLRDHATRLYEIAGELRGQINIFLNT